MSEDDGLDEQSNESRDVVFNLPPKTKERNPVPELLLDFDEGKMMVTINLEDGGDLTYSLQDLKQVFHKKKDHCKLDWTFMRWDLKLKKFRQQYDENKL